MAERLYTALFTFENELKEVQKDGSAAGNTSGLWMVILQYYFAVRDGFAHRPEYRTSRGGFTDITSVRWIEGSHTTYHPYLITQTKAAKYQNQDAEWTKGEEQLKNYLGALGETVTQRKWLWGILAIGELVKFYEFNGSRPKEKFNISNNAQTITNMLLEIKKRCS